jgi:hypothetical protein
MPGITRKVLSANFKPSQPEQPASDFSGELPARPTCWKKRTKEIYSQFLEIRSQELSN